MEVAGLALAAAALATSVAESIERFIRDTVQIDDTIEGLKVEVGSLHSICLSVHDRVPALMQEVEQRQAGQVLQSHEGLGRQLGTCMETLQDLRNTISGVGISGTNWIRQAWRQFRLSRRSQAIQSIRNKIQTHTSALQLSLQLVSL